ncbi:MAG: polysaccharide pyruvyl transferase family protein [Oscillospiraceae bacterium]|nr:polysaccharide pyruvyl transferase family protein [Oscillospiraceae bacterium]
MKIGLVTIVSPGTNYGNALQNYAAEQVLQRLGAEVCTLRVQWNPSLSGLYCKRAINRLTGCKLSPKQAQWRQTCRFLWFRKKHLHLRDDLLRGKNPAAEFDFFAVGSDQVWNPLWWDTPGKRNHFLLQFAPPEKRICMAPSFGIEELPETWKPVFARELRQFEFLSCRERSGVPILRELTGREAEVVLDPTLMLDAAEWRTLARPVRVPTGQRYLLTCFLGDVSPERRNGIQRLANERHLTVLELQNEAFPALYPSGPQEFLYLIDHAALVCTDSFHAAAFSILFQRPLWVMRREQRDMPEMFSRITSLLTLLHLDGCAVEMAPDGLFLAGNYPEAHTVLNAEREKSMDFLRKSLHLTQP